MGACEIQTARLRLVAADEKVIKAIEQGPAHLSKILNAKVIEPWTVFGVEGIIAQKALLPRQKNPMHWYAWLPVLKDPARLIGNGGYKGPPDDKGRVEIGYEIIPKVQGQGLATEMARGLIDRAFTFPEVKVVIAHTLGQFNASTVVLGKCGFQRTGEVLDTEDGTISRWELIKPKLPVQ